jgi:hypothetical protein
MGKYKKLKENFERSYDFYHDLAMRESSGKPRIREEKHGNYLGLYQMGKDALIDAGYFKNVPSTEGSFNYDASWQGVWTGKLGIFSKEDFLDNPDVQKIAIREYHQKVTGYIRSIKQYQGQEIAGVKLTEGGMIATAHLVGHGGLKEFVRSNGQKDPEDGNRIPCSDYLRFFDDQRYDNIEMNVEGRLKDYMDQHPKLEQERIRQQYGLEEDFFDFLNISEDRQKQADKDAAEILSAASKASNSYFHSEQDVRDFVNAGNDNVKRGYEQAGEFLNNMAGGYNLNNLSKGHIPEDFWDTIENAANTTLKEHGAFFADIGLSVPADAADLMGNIPKFTPDEEVD